MRIVAGSARGRRLVAPEGTSTRPTSERVREAMFNALFSLGVLEEATVCDLFAGSGALGLEALSRGAAEVTFVERDRAALHALRTNIDALDVGDQATVRQAEALSFAATSSRSREASSPAFDLLIADPPYDFDEWETLLDAVSAGLVVIESGRTPPEHPRWEVIRQRRYGSTVLTFMTDKTEGNPLR